MFCRIIFPKEFSGDCVNCVPVWKKHPAPGIFWFFFGGDLFPSQASSKAFLALMCHSLVINYLPRLIYRKRPKFTLSVAESSAYFG